MTVIIGAIGDLADRRRCPHILHVRVAYAPLRLTAGASQQPTVFVKLGCDAVRTAVMFRINNDAAAEDWSTSGWRAVAHRVTSRKSVRVEAVNDRRRDLAVPRASSSQ